MRSYGLQLKWAKLQKYNENGTELNLLRGETNSETDFYTLWTHMALYS